MRMFNNIEECMTYANAGINHCENIKQIISPNDYEIWEQKLREKIDFENYLINESKLNLLNLSILTGYGLANNADDFMFAHYRRLLDKLNNYLATFPVLLSDESFIAKVKNIEQFSFLSLITELSLASYFKTLQLNIKFETAFRLIKSNKKRDVDITVSDSKGNEMHLEVYMPNKQSEIDGFFNPGDDDHHFEYKIGKKLLDKFGENGIADLKGTTLLAVNIAFFDMLQIKRTINPQQDFTHLLQYLPTGVDGFFVFEDNFRDENSFRFIQWVLK